MVGAGVVGVVVPVLPALVVLPVLVLPVVPVVADGMVVAGWLSVLSPLELHAANEIASTDSAETL